MSGRRGAGSIAFAAGQDDPGDASGLIGLSDGGDIAMPSSADGIEPSASIVGFIGGHTPHTVCAMDQQATNEVTTQVYTRVTINDLRDVHKRFHPRERDPTSD